MLLNINLNAFSQFHFSKVMIINQNNFSQFFFLSDEMNIINGLFISSCFCAYLCSVNGRGNCFYIIDMIETQAQKGFYFAFFLLEKKIYEREKNKSDNNLSFNFNIFINILSSYFYISITFIWIYIRRKKVWVVYERIEFLWCKNLKRETLGCQVNSKFSKCHQYFVSFFRKRRKMALGKQNLKITGWNLNVNMT